jgi:hypothetical protein
MPQARVVWGTAAGMGEVGWSALPCALLSARAQLRVFLCRTMLPPGDMEPQRPYHLLWDQACRTTPVLALKWCCLARMQHRCGVWAVVKDWPFGICPAHWCAVPCRASSFGLCYCCGCWVCGQGYTWSFLVQVVGKTTTVAALGCLLCQVLGPVCVVSCAPWSCWPSTATWRFFTQHSNWGCRTCAAAANCPCDYADVLPNTWGLAGPTAGLGSKGLRTVLTETQQLGCSEFISASSTPRLASRVLLVL